MICYLPRVVHRDARLIGDAKLAGERAEERPVPRGDLVHVATAMQVEHARRARAEPIAGMTSGIVDPDVMLAAKFDARAAKRGAQAPA